MVRRLVSVIVLACVVTIGYWAGVTYAWNVYGYFLVGGINFRTFYVGDPNGNWATHIRNGVEAWNGSWTKAYFRETTSNSDATLAYYVGDFGALDWCGYAFFRDAQGLYIRYGYTPDQNWYKSEAKIQDPPIPGCPAYSKQAAAAHEMGHAMGLYHSDESGVVMSAPSASNTPQQDDIDGLNWLYGHP